MAKIPEQIGKYKILSHLGSGGSSIVYLGMHPTLKRKVVLKKLNLRGKKTFYDRFLQEAALMMDLNHDHIVKVYDHFKEGSRHYMVMEFVEGVSLDHLLETTAPLEHETIRYILRCCCKALSYIHSRKIIHRDIKPSNIFISTRGDVKLGDFGIAMFEDLSDQDDRNRDEAFPLIGTPAYMAPEQFTGRGHITPRTDLYALGVSYFELLTKKKLFAGESLDEMRASVLKGRHPSLFFLIRSYGFSSWRIIRRCIFRVPLFRFSSSSQILRALHTFRMDEAGAKEDLSYRIQSLSSKSGPLRREGASLGKSGLSQVLGVRRRVSRVVPAVLILSAVLLGFLGAIIYTGKIYSWFLPDRYGKFSLELIQENSGHTFLLETLELYRDEEGTKTLLGHWDDSTESERSFIQKTGFYSLKVSWGNRIAWKSFYLPPFSIQDEDLVIELKAPPLLTQLLDVKIFLSDALTGMPLNPDGYVFIRSPEGDWSPLSDESTVVSGYNYKVRAGLPGYFESDFDISLKFFQDSLILEAALRPLPGQLVVHHNMDSLRLRVNDKKALSGGGLARDKQHFGSLPMEGNSWSLAPGIYELSWSGAGWKEKQKLTIRSGELVQYRITPEIDNFPHFDINRSEMAYP